jgi:hypothetical protein
MLIDVYTRQQAIKDGEQILATGDLAQIARDLGYKYPVYFTRSVQALIQRAVDNPGCHNDWSGVFHSLIWMSQKCIKFKTNDSVIFRCQILGAGRKKWFDFVMQCGATDIDNPLPALTLMLPEDV